MHKALWTNAHLPYPQLVTLFLRHFQIPLDDESFVQVKRSFVIDAGAVTSFGYRKDHNGQWLRKQDLSHERIPSPPSQQDVSSAFMNDVLSELRGLRAFVGDCFDVMDARFTGMDTCITRLEDDMGFSRHCFDPPADP